MLLLALASTGLLAALATAQTINSPASVTVCLPQQLTISGGTPPYTITVLPAGHTGGVPIETLPTVNAPGSVTWLVDIPAGQTVTFSVRDSTGSQGFSSQVPVIAGTSTSCLGTNSAASRSATVAPLTSTGASSEAGTSHTSRHSSTTEVSSREVSSSATSSSATSSVGVPILPSGNSRNPSPTSASTPASVTTSSSNIAKTAQVGLESFCISLAAVFVAIVF
ncbi:hypothetical protein JCM1840_003317 [Sporobolomyces johnsonii]